MLVKIILLALDTATNYKLVLGLWFWHRFFIKSYFFAILHPSKHCVMKKQKHLFEDVVMFL